MGVAATGAAFLLCRSDWRATHGVPSPSACSVFIGIAPVLLVAVGELRLDKFGALLVYSAQAAWVALIQPALEGS